MASAEIASALSASPPSRTPRRDPLPARVISGFLVAAVLGLLLWGGRTLTRHVAQEWLLLGFWVSLVIVVDLFPVAVGGRRLTFDFPLLLAVALLYPPEVAAAVALVGAVDLRELKGEVGLSRALFNRAQIALSVLAASAVFNLVGGHVTRLATAVPSALAALIADYATNALLVVLHVAAREGVRPGDVVRRLKVGDYREFLTTYLGYGLLALALARLFLDLGPLSVAIFLIPLFVARGMLVKSQESEVLANKLQQREDAVQESLGRIVDERKDERARIAGELHDDVLQSLTKIWMLGRTIESRKGLDGMVARDAHELVGVVSRSMQSLRDVILDLRKSPLGRGGLVPTLRSLVRDLRLQGETRIHCDLPSREIDLAAESKVIVYQIAREALLNALMHARASEIRLTLEVNRGYLEVQVQDDGIGLPQRSIGGTSQQHFGLKLMEDRVRRLGGKLTIDSRKRHGTRIGASIPLEDT